MKNLSKKFIISLFSIHIMSSCFISAGASDFNLNLILSNPKAQYIEIVKQGHFGKDITFGIWREAIIKSAVLEKHMELNNNIVESFQPKDFQQEYEEYVEKYIKNSSNFNKNLILQMVLIGKAI